MSEATQATGGRTQRTSPKSPESPQTKSITKALALDPAPSAPGVEPVVVPVRIVSTDKLAAKAGGLQVALDGVPVRPGDEADATKN